MQQRIWKMLFKWSEFKLIHWNYYKFIPPLTPTKIGAWTHRLLHSQMMRAYTQSFLPWNLCGGSRFRNTQFWAGFLYAGKSWREKSFGKMWNTTASTCSRAERSIVHSQFLWTGHWLKAWSLVSALRLSYIRKSLPNIFVQARIFFFWWVLLPPEVCSATGELPLFDSATSSSTGFCISYLSICIVVTRNTNNPIENTRNNFWQNLPLQWKFVRRLEEGLIMLYGALLISVLWGGSLAFVYIVIVCDILLSSVLYKYVL